MTQLAKLTIDGDILSRSDCVRVVGRPHPLKSTRVELYVPAGNSVSELLAIALAGVEGAHPTKEYIVEVDGVGIPRIVDDVEWWPRVRPKPGATVTFRPRLGNLRSVLMLAVAVAALVVAGPLAAAIGLTGVALTIGTALISTGIILGGTLALNALFPIRPPQLDAANSSNSSFTQLPSIAGAQNQSTPFEPISVVLGLHRLSPVYGAKSYTEIVGDDQYLRLLFVWGYGPLTLSDFKIGETPITSFSDYQIEHRQGFANDTPLTLFPGEVFEAALSIVLTSAGGWTSQTTSPDTDEISVDYMAPEGIFRIDSNGNYVDYAVSIATQYRAVGAATWINMPTVTFGRSTKTARLNSRIAVTRGQYEVQASKTTADANNTNIKDSVTWTALRSFRNDPPIHFTKPLAMTALRIRATDQLNGVVNTFNGAVESLVDAFDGVSTWNANTSSVNPADLFRVVLQGPANARPVADALIDISNLQEWWIYCDTNGFTFNQVRSAKTSVYDCLADIAAAGRAVPTFIDGKWGVIWDRPNDTIVQHFTPRNSWDFKGSRPYAQLPHGWRVKFINANNGWTQDERIVYDDGYDSNNATLFEAIEFPGVTDPGLIWRHGRFHIAQSRLRPEDVALTTGWENIVCTRGDRVRVTHDVLLIGQISGRVKSISGQTIAIDETVTIEAGKTYGFVFRLADPNNTSIIRAVDLTSLTPGDYTAVPLIGDLTVVSSGDLFGFGETDQETAVYRVKSIQHQKDLIATLTLVDDAPAISTADTGVIPAYNPNVTLPVDPFTQPPQNLQYIEFVEGYGANATVEVRLSWTIPHDGNITAFEVQNKDENSSAPAWSTVGTVPYPLTTFDVPLIASGVWSYRVRCLFSDGTSSDWATLPTLSLQGLLAPPDEVANFRATYISGRTYLTWDMPTNAQGVLFEIRKGASWDAALVIGERIAQPPFQTVGDDTYWNATFVVTPFGQKIYSNTKHSLLISGSVLTANVVVSRDEKANGWQGYFGGTVGRDDGLGYLRTSGSTNMLAETDFLNDASILNAGGQGGGYFRSNKIVDAGRVMPCRVSVDFTATAVPAASDFLGDPDFLNNPDFLQSYLTQFIRVYPVVRVGEASDPNVFGPADIFGEDDAFAAGIVWGDWQKWSPDYYLGRFFQIGLVFEILDVTVGAIAYGLSFSWVVDVEDRLDRYQNLTVPVGGLAISFTPTGSATAKPFIGGINNESLPHILTDYLDRPSGYEVKVTGLTKAGCAVSVFNGSGVDVGGTGINVFAQGY